MRRRRTASSQTRSRWAAWARHKRASKPWWIWGGRPLSPGRACMSTAARPLVAGRRCVMWSDRRVAELFEIEHPIVLAPMAGLGTVDLAAAVSNAGGLGSIGCAIMAPELIAKSVAELRRSTPKPINLNFFCHDPAKADAARERAWHEKLSSYYRELGIHPATSTPRFDLAPFGDAACAVIGEVRPE